MLIYAHVNTNSLLADKLTCNVEPSDTRKKYKGHDMGYFLSSTGDMRASMGHGHSSDKGH